jgi:uncharacterized protein YndB with AHSA1/START domain
MRRQALGYMQVFETSASAATLWRALTETSALKTWLATEALVEPRAGGRYETVSRLFGRREAQIGRFDVASRMQLLYHPNADWPPLPDSTISEDFIIDDRNGRRKMRMMGSAVPAGEEQAKTLVRLRTGWAIAFAQLQLRLKDGSIAEVQP